MSEESIPGKRVVYAVAPGKSILTGKSVLLKEHTIVNSTNDDWMKQVGLYDQDIAKFISTNRLVECILSDAGQLTTPARDTLQVSPTLPGAVSGAGIRQEDAGSGIIPPDMPAQGSPPGQAVGHWGYDPASLVNSSLQELNGLVFGIEPEMPPFETTEEAVAQLSQDFRAQAVEAAAAGDRVSG